MGTISSFRGRLLLDFYLRGKRCRESTGMHDTPTNRRKLQGVLKQIEAEIVLGNFDYAKYFPNSRKAKITPGALQHTDSPSFRDFAHVWFEEKQVEWRDTTREYARVTLGKYLLPFFGNMQLALIAKEDILRFRARLASSQGKGAGSLSASRINHIMSILKAIVDEGTDRFGHDSVWRNIKRLRGQPKEVMPFSLQEVMALIDAVRPDFRNYLTVRFFTGMRSGEIDGLQWEDVDTANGIITVRRSWVLGKFVPTKTDGSRRTILMSSIVRRAFEDQKRATGSQNTFVFRSADGQPIRHGNFRTRVWIPLLKYLGYKMRTPYHTRHTAATLWLAAGESPEWIAKQLGHSSTEMLFRVYSNYVPNLTRQDGSAFERLLQHEQKTLAPQSVE